MNAYYNENDRFAAAWLRGLIERSGCGPENDVSMPAGWPTASARDWKSSASNKHGENARPLNEVARLTGWPTTTVNDSRSGRNRTAERSNPESNHHDWVTLTDAVSTLGATSDGTPAETEGSGPLRLNARFPSGCKGTRTSGPPARSRQFDCPGGRGRVHPRVAGGGRPMRHRFSVSSVPGIERCACGTERTLVELTTGEVYWWYRLTNYAAIVALYERAGHSRGPNTLILESRMVWPCTAERAA